MNVQNTKAGKGDKDIMLQTENRENDGFSLIELLVVIAIIGILTAVAMPLYRDYTVRAKVSSAMPVFERLISTINNYYAKHGVFPTAYSLGLGTDSGSPYLTTSSLIAQMNPNLNAVYINNFYSGRQGEIGLVFKMTNFNGYNSGAATLPNLISGTGNFLFLTMFVNANSNGVTSTRCVYRTDWGMTAAIAATYFPPSCQTGSGVPGPAPT